MELVKILKRVNYTPYLKERQIILFRGGLFTRCKRSVYYVSFFDNEKIKTKRVDPTPDRKLGDSQKML